jgi:multiple sugar transport system substrate-binding protein
MNSKIDDPQFISRRRFVVAAAASLAGVTLAACGAGGGGGAQTAAQPAAGGGAAAAQPTTAGAAAAPAQAGGAVTSIKWSTWGNPGEIDRFKQFTDDFNKRTPNIKAELIPIPNDGYGAKMLTQLSGGTAPDMFYSGDGDVGKLIASKQLLDLTETLKGAKSKSRPEEFFDGLWGAARTADGKLYGAVVDCNPMVLWYNKKVLQEAGVSQMPADLAKAGQWDWKTFQGMLDQIVAKGKRGFIQENWWATNYPWATANGGKIVDGGKFVANTDPKALESFQFIYDNLQKKTFTYSGSLPKGQGVDAMFMSQQAGFIGAGRWLLPVFKKNAGLEYDIVTYPTNTSKKLEPEPIPTAYAVINAKSPNPDAAFAFLTDFVSKDGQTFRLKGGGNAVPSVRGADTVVSEDNLPQNWQALIDAREVGYAHYADLASVAGLPDELHKVFDELWLQGGDVKTTLNKAAEVVAQKTKAQQG